MLWYGVYFMNSINKHTRNNNSLYCLIIVGIAGIEIFTIGIFQVQSNKYYKYFLIYRFTCSKLQIDIEYYLFNIYSILTLFRDCIIYWIFLFYYVKRNILAILPKFVSHYGY